MAALDLVQLEDVVERRALDHYWLPLTVVPGDVAEERMEHAGFVLDKKWFLPSRARDGLLKYLNVCQAAFFDVLLEPGEIAGERLKGIDPYIGARVAANAAKKPTLAPTSITVSPRLISYPAGLYA